MRVVRRTRQRGLRDWLRTSDFASFGKDVVGRDDPTSYSLDHTWTCVHPCCLLRLQSLHAWLVHRDVHDSRHPFYFIIHRLLLSITRSSSVLFWEFCNFAPHCTTAPDHCTRTTAPDGPLHHPCPDGVQSTPTHPPNRTEAAVALWRCGAVAMHLAGLHRTNDDRIFIRSKTFKIYYKIAINFK